MAVTAITNIKNSSSILMLQLCVAAVTKQQQKNATIRNEMLQKPRQRERDGNRIRI